MIDMKIVSKFSKSLIISLLGISIFTISSCDNTSYTDASGNNENDDSRYGIPCDKTLGNGNYVLHNFSGEETGVLRAKQIEKDLNYYLDKGETYVMDLVDKFSESLQDRPTAQSYFNEFIHAQKSNEFQRLDENGINPYSFDNTINGIINPCRPIFENFIPNINNSHDRVMFITCYQTITNEAYKYGLGTGCVF